jgi:hypothetical protein
MAGKSLRQLEADVNATLRLVLCEMEELAQLDPLEATEVYSFDDRRRRVFRRVWDLFKEAIHYDPRGTAE